MMAATIRVKPEGQKETEVTELAGSVEIPLQSFDLYSLSSELQCHLQASYQTLTSGSRDTICTMTVLSLSSYS